MYYITNRNSNKIITDILNDFVYELTLVRTMNWIKNRIHFLQRIIRDRVSFYKFIQKIKDWNSRRFNIERRIKYMCYSLLTISINLLLNYRIH